MAADSGTTMPRLTMLRAMPLTWFWRMALTAATLVLGPMTIGS